MICCFVYFCVKNIILCDLLNDLFLFGITPCLFQWSAPEFFFTFTIFSGFGSGLPDIALSFVPADHLSDLFSGYLLLNDFNSVKCFNNLLLPLVDSSPRS